MIRVTLKAKDNKQYQKQYKDMYYLRETQAYEYFVKNEPSPTLDITKIEKKVKDLTLEEAHKLGLGIHYFDSWYKVYQIVDGQAIELKMNDYIDITSIVKGE